MDAHPDRQDGRIPEGIEICRHLDDGRIEDVIRLSRGELDGVAMEQLLHHRRTVLVPFTGVLPPERDPRVIGAVTGVRVPYAGPHGNACELGAFYVESTADAEHLRRHMLGVLKTLLREIRCDALRVLVGTDEEDMERQLDWFWSEGFTGKPRYSPKHQAYVLFWHPSMDRTRNRLPAS